jgi:hypothetical protein
MKAELLNRFPQFQQVRHKNGQAFYLGANMNEELMIFRVFPDVLAKSIGDRQDGVQRVPDLMGYSRDNLPMRGETLKAAFLNVCLFQLPHILLQIADHLIEHFDQFPDLIAA